MSTIDGGTLNCRQQRALGRVQRTLTFIHDYDLQWTRTLWEEFQSKRDAIEEVERIMLAAIEEGVSSNESPDLAYWGVGAWSEENAVAYLHYWLGREYLNASNAETSGAEEFEKAKLYLSLAYENDHWGGFASRYYARVLSESNDLYEQRQLARIITEEARQGLSSEGELGVNRFGAGDAFDWLPRPAVTEAQRILKELGYYKGAIDGLVGPQFRNAMQQLNADCSSFPKKDTLDYCM